MVKRYTEVPGTSYRQLAPDHDGLLKFPLPNFTFLSL